LAPNAALGGAYVNQTVVGILATYSNGLQDLVFGLDLTSWEASCWVLAHAALSWVLHDIIPGQRRSLLSTQVSLGSLPLHSTRRKQAVHGVMLFPKM
jgi:hypothetical protein